MKIRVKFEIVKEETGEVYRVDRQGAVEDHAGTLSVDLAGSKGISINGSLPEAVLHALEKGPVGFWSTTDLGAALDRATNAAEETFRRTTGLEPLPDRGEFPGLDSMFDVATPTATIRTVQALIDEAIKSHEERRHADDWKNAVYGSASLNSASEEIPPVGEPRPPSNWRETEELEAGPIGGAPPPITDRGGHPLIAFEYSWLSGEYSACFDGDFDCVGSGKTRDAALEDLARRRLERERTAGKSSLNVVGKSEIVVTYLKSLACIRNYHEASLRRPDGIAVLVRNDESPRAAFMELMSALWESRDEFKDVLSVRIEDQDEPA